MQLDEEYKSLIAESLILLERSITEDIDGWYEAVCDKFIYRGDKFTEFVMKKTPAYNSRNMSDTSFSFWCGSHCLISWIDDGYNNQYNQHKTNLFYKVKTHIAEKERVAALEKATIDLKNLLAKNKREE